MKKLPSILCHSLSLICPAVTNEEKLEDFWSLEQIGIKDSPTINDDDMALKNFQETIDRKNKRYYVQWPFKKEDLKLTNNFGLSYGRLQSSIKKLKLDNRINDYSSI